MLRILLVSNDTVLSDRINLLLNENGFRDVELVRVDTGEEAWTKLRNKFNLLLLDLDVTATKILGFVSQVREEYFAMPLISFSFDLEYAFVKRCLTNGVTGYCRLAENDLQELVCAIRKNQDQKVYISPVMVEMVASEALYCRKPDRLDSLDRQEFDILLHLKKGTPFLEIAQTFGVHVSTISFYKSRILDKLMISDIAELDVFLKMESAL